ncbi:hypothetical protein AAFH68_36670 [Flavobacterium sp. CGRL1]
MEANQYIESGILEMYVYGLLTEKENLEIAELARENPEIESEIISIEKAVSALSSSFSPFHSAANFEKTKARLELDHGKVVNIRPASKRPQYLGWAVAALMLLGFGYQTLELAKSKQAVSEAGGEKNKIEREYAFLDQQNKQTEKNLSIVRDIKNISIALGGQSVSPASFAKVYWNRETKNDLRRRGRSAKPSKRNGLPGLVFKTKSGAYPDKYWSAG